ncbi:class I SAM-dependent methyltransferase [Actinobacillus equuli subsp. haemolyticus]|uniref:class I SAM-dependent methyltransferase n=1 Tax=Actinobacillus equuli TaxID=718 RepID=UPI00244127A7|nr:class I SAM-dependent methyltransferase [Actinobacillus equuli]WGE67594.1 class I SAM-dependent methyltransferase [Actinobacillus equuli subsp. haemolyticus]
MKKSIYDTPIFFERYQQLRENPISMNEVVEKPTMFSLLPDLTKKKVLDLGCGTGVHLAHYLELGASKVIGLDLSELMLKQAESDLAKNWQKSTAFSLHCLPMEQLDKIPEDNFDVVTSSFAFHYIEDFADLLAKISAKMTACGTLIFSQEHPIVTCYREGYRWEKNEQKQQVAYRLNFYRDEGERDRSWFQQAFKTYHRTMATICNQLIQAGFEIVQVEEPMLAEQPQWHNEFKDLQHRPPLLFIKAVKKG